MYTSRFLRSDAKKIHTGTQIQTFSISSARIFSKKLQNRLFVYDALTSSVEGGQIYMEYPNLHPKMLDKKKMIIQ